MTIQEQHHATDGFKELRSYLSAFLEEYAIKKIMAREDISGVADANDIIEAAFAGLDEKFTPKEKIPTVLTSSR